MNELSRRDFLGAFAGAVAASAWGEGLGAQSQADTFEGEFFAGEGDVGYLRLLDASRRLFRPDPEFQSIPMLYSPSWNGFVEGPTWGAWWIQNSYGPSYCAMPFFEEPYTTFLQNSQDLWFTQMGDGERKGANDWVAPDGCLCDYAAPNWVYYKQGDGRVEIHDWGMEFTAAGVVLQAELLLIGRDMEAIRHYLPGLERSANFIETRRDPANNLFLAGPAGNLLAPSYAGWCRPDGTYDKAYLTGLSVTYIAGLDRLISLERMAGNQDKAQLYEERRRLAKAGLPLLTTDEGYLIKYLDPDGARHGVYGAAQHGYFEAVCNHDAIAFRVVDDDQAGRIYDKIASIPGLRPHDVIITNYPSLDDMYIEPDGLWRFGPWINGGHWTTCEARMILGYYRLGKFEDARRSMEHIMSFARIFRMDNPLTEFGASVYQPGEPVNCVYDTWGAPAAMVRGLFEYLYGADGLTLVPHIPPGITRLQQRFPIRFGKKRLYLETRGSGSISAVWVNNRLWESFDGTSVFLHDNDCPDEAHIEICLGGAWPGTAARPSQAPAAPIPPADSPFWDVESLVLGLPPRKPRPLRIGADGDGEHRFVGEMRLARVYRRALVPEEIVTLAANSGAAPPADGSLVADFRLRSAESGQVANDATPGLHAMVIGDLQAVGFPGDRVLRFGGHGYLDAGTDARLLLPAALTLEAWVRPGRLPDVGARIIDKVTVGRDDGYLLDTTPGNSLRFITQRGAVSFDANLEPGAWAHLAATFEPRGELKLYINGKLVASAPATQTETAFDGVSLPQIGAFYTRLCELDLGDCYEARHAKLIVDFVQAMNDRAALAEQGRLPRLPELSQAAADRSYLEATNRLAQGLAALIASYEGSQDPHKIRVLAAAQY